MSSRIDWADLGTLVVDLLRRKLRVAELGRVLLLQFHSSSKRYDMKESRPRPRIAHGHEHFGSTLAPQIAPQ